MVSRSNSITAENSLASDYLADHHLEHTPDGQYIRWHRANPIHPRNWSVWRKCFDTGLILLLDFFLYAQAIVTLDALRANFLIGQLLALLAYVLENRDIKSNR